MAEGQAGTFTAFIADVNQRWRRAAEQPWYSLLSGLEAELNEGLAWLDALPYDEFYDVDGSVPETMQKKMDDLYYKISDTQEADFQGYLFKGYESVRNRDLGDIDKWRMGSGINK